MGTMGLKRIWWAILVTGSLSVHGVSQPPDRVTIELHVTVPGGTPDNAAVCITGNQRAAGNWQPDAQHNEHYWSLRFDRMLLYFFGTNVTGKATRWPGGVRDEASGGIHVD